MKLTGVLKEVWRRFYSNRTLMVLLGLALVSILGFSTHIPSIKSGMPFFNHEDEAHHFNRLAEMLKANDLNPHYFHKPSLHFYLRLPVLALSFISEVKKENIRSVQEIKTRDPFGKAGYNFTASHPRLVKLNRAFSSFLCIGSGLCFALLAYFYFHSELAAFCCLVLTILSPAMTKYGIPIGVDGPVTFFACLSTFLATFVYHRFSLGNLFVLAIVCGLTISTKYNAAPIFFLPICVQILRRDFSLLGILICLAMPLIGFFIGSPFIFVEPGLFLDHLAWEAWHYGVEGHIGHQANPGISQAWFYISWFLKEDLGFLVFLFSIIGVFFAFKNKPKVSLLVFFYPALFFLFMCTQKVNFERNMIPVLPFVAFFAALGARELLQSLSIVKESWKIGVSFLIIGLLAFQPILRASGQRLDVSLRRDSRSSVYSWILEKEHGKSATPLPKDLAIDGDLQLPLFLKGYGKDQKILVPGITRFTKDEADILNLFLKGYRSFVFGPSKMLPANMASYFTRLKVFPGQLKYDNPRVVENPEVKVFVSNDGEFLSYLTESENSSRLADFDSEVSSEEASNKVKILCSELEEESSEGYCWMNERVQSLKIQRAKLVSIIGSKDYILNFEAMTPWPNQEVRFFIGDSWSYDYQFYRTEDSNAGSESKQLGDWEIISLSIPKKILDSDLSFFMAVKEIHSPSSYYGGQDPRRLGVALR